jgi:hypothetical protein
VNDPELASVILPSSLHVGDVIEWSEKGARFIYTVYYVEGARCAIAPSTANFDRWLWDADATHLAIRIVSRAVRS